MECVGELNDPLDGVNGTFVVTSGRGTVAGMTLVGRTVPPPERECACRVMIGRFSGQTAGAAVEAAVAVKDGAASDVGTEAGNAGAGASDGNSGAEWGS